MTSATHRYDAALGGAIYPLEVTGDGHRVSRRRPALFRSELGPGLALRAAV